MKNSEAGIRVEDLRKSYRVARRSSGLGAAMVALVKPKYDEIKALDGISFSIRPGEIVGYIGPNGAGKSSTIKVLSGILVPDGGICLVDGRVPWKERIAHVRGIGVVFGQRSQLWWDVPVQDSFELLRDIYRVEEGAYRAELGRLSEMLGLGPLLGLQARQLSLGQRMRCEIAASLLHAPSILFLDEPTIGLDAPSKLAVRKFILELNRERGLTVILTTHDMQDVEALVQRVIMIGKGRTLYDGSLAEMRSLYGTERVVTVDFSGGSIPAALPAVAGAALVAAQGARAAWRLDTRTVAVSRFLAEVSASGEVADLTVEDAPVEELVVKLYEEHRV